MANITVKKNDGTTDQIWTQVQASGGDKSPAIWRNLSVGSASLYNPELALSGRSNAANTVRRLDGQVNWKQSATGTDGIIKVVNTAYIKCEMVIPQGMPSVDLNEFVSQALNLLASTLIKDSAKAGFAPV